MAGNTVAGSIPVSSARITTNDWKSMTPNTVSSVIVSDDSAYVGKHEGVIEAAEPMVEPHSYQLTILISLARLGKHVYGGTVSHKTKMKRRARGKVAKASRKTNYGL